MPPIGRAGALSLVAWLVAAGSPIRAQALLTLAQQDRHPVTGPAFVSLSADGRFVALSTFAAPHAVDGDGAEVCVVDRHTGQRWLESRTPLEWPTQVFIGNRRPRLSGDARWLVFEATIDYGGIPRVGPLLKDRVTGTVRAVARGRDGEPPDRPSTSGVPSHDAHLVAFTSSATNLVAGTDANGHAEDVYVLDVETGVTTRASVDNEGRQRPSGASFAPAISGDGHLVAFVSTAALEAPAQSPSTDRRGRASRPTPQVYVRDLSLGHTTRITRGRRGEGPDGSSTWPSLSADGRFVAFASQATNLVPGDRNDTWDVFVFDRHTGVTELVSRPASGGSANGDSTHPVISGDGRFVVFQSRASDLVCAKRCAPKDEDVNLVWDVFLFDRATGTTRRLSADGSGGWMAPSLLPVIDPSGSVAAFSSYHPTGPDDLAHDLDAFLVEVDASPPRRTAR